MENFSKILKITDKDGNKHSYVANYVDGELTPDCKEDIERLKNGENLLAPKGEKDFVGDVPFDVVMKEEMEKLKSKEPKVEDVDEDEMYDQMESMGDMPSDMQLHKALKKADTNDNGKIEVDEMADFQKSLDDYASKNKKGRDDIPVTTRR